MACRRETPRPEAGRAAALVAAAVLFCTLTSGCQDGWSGGGTLAPLLPAPSGERSVPSTSTLPPLTRIDLSRYAGQVVRHGDRRRHAVALTFDDGPSEHTARVLSILRAGGARATFFFVGGRTIGREYRVVEALSQGCEIGNHTFNHRVLTGMTPVSFDSEVMRTQRLFLKECGWAPPLLRPRGGVYDWSLPPLARRAGLAIVLWDVQAGDAANPSATVASITRNATAVTDGSIVVMHETNPLTVEALPRIISDLKARGYDLVTVSELLSGR